MFFSSEKIKLTNNCNVVVSLFICIVMVVVAFIHPDLGIGGAERLICDAALALQSQGHEVKIYTSHHDKSHCFAETADGKLNVVAIGDWMPRHIFHRFYALWAYIRMIYVAFYLVFLSTLDPDVIVCDQISACIPILKMSNKAKVIFYCHFPDLLLTQRTHFLKRIYRVPIDWLEEFTTGKGFFYYFSEYWCNGHVDAMSELHSTGI